MKRIISSILFFILLFSSCNKEDDPVTANNSFRMVTYKVTGAATNVLITISGVSGVTQYEHVRLPFTLEPFQLEKGDFAGFNVLDWDNTNSAMIAQVVSDGNVVQDTTGVSFLQLGLILE